MQLFSYALLKITVTNNYHLLLKEQWPLSKNGETDGKSIKVLTWSVSLEHLKNDNHLYVDSNTLSTDGRWRQKQAIEKLGNF